MICLIALVVFGVLGIFSATHRRLAKESFNCVFRTLTLRPCDTGFDQRVKGKIVGWFFKRSPRVAGIVSKHFQVFSWLLVILLFGSMIYSGYALYNLAVHGSCSPQNPEGCFLSPAQEEAGCTCETAKTEECLALSSAEDCGPECECLGEECS